MNDLRMATNPHAIDPAMAALCACLDAFARVADEMVIAAESRLAPDRITQLFERFEAHRDKAAAASRAAAGVPVPTGPLGAELVSALKACNARIRTGSEAAEKLIAYRQTVDRFGEQFVLQAIRNLPAIAAAPSAIRLRDAFRGRPSVIVSAGPSLEKNVHALARFKGKAVILAVSHAALALQRAGIVPDLVIATDAQDLRYHFEGVPVEKLGGMVFGTSVEPELFALNARRFFTIAANPAIDSWVYEGLEEVVVLSSGGSVANDAFSLVTLWGCDPIILIGQDLSFPDGRFYAASGCDGAARMTLSNDGSHGLVEEASDGYRRLGGADAPVIMREVPGYYGGTVSTSFAFQRAWAWFVDAARALESQRTVINCTEGGARIDGMEHIPLNEAAERYAKEDLDVEAVLDACLAQIDPKARRLHTLARVRRMSAALAQCATKASECSSLAERGKTRPALLQKLRTAEMELARALEGVSFVSAMIQKDLRLAVAAGKRASSANDGLAASLAIYTAVTRVVGLVGGPLDRAQRALSTTTPFGEDPLWERPPRA